MKAIGKIGWNLIISVYTLAFAHLFNYDAVVVFRTTHFARQRALANRIWPFPVPPAYVIETGWFFATALSTAGWFFWLQNKAELDPEYDVVNVIVMLITVLIKVYYYLVHTTRYPTGAGVCLTVTAALALVVLIVFGWQASWKTFWYWMPMPLWLVYVTLFSYGIAAVPEPPVSDADPAVGKELMTDE